MYAIRIFRHYFVVPKLTVADLRGGGRQGFREPTPKIFWVNAGDFSKHLDPLMLYEYCSEW